jgi:hypothetical protein
MARRPAGGEPPAPLACPSAPPEWDGARLIGIAGGTAEAPEIRFVLPRPVTPELLALAGPVTPAEVFRFTAPCQESACRHFRGGRCGVAAAVIAHIAPDAEGPLPPCAIRPECRWWAERGPDACRRCRHVVTDDAARTGAFADALAG